MKSAIDPAPHRFDGSRKFSIKKAPSSVPALYSDKKDYKEKLKDFQKQINEVQEKMYAEDTYSALFVFQAMDAAGKDGAIGDIFANVNPHGVEVHAFKQPSSLELDHSYLWRTDIRMPSRGHFGVFNRSYYEEVLVVKVHPEIVQSSQRLPANKTRHLDKLWEERYRQIREKELMESENGMLIVKFFLHLSKEEQARRFLARIEEPEKNWKFSEGDVKERAFWDEYMAAYEEAINQTATPHAPWYVIPADDKKTARLLIAAALLHELGTLPIEWPSVSEDRLAELDVFRTGLLQEVSSGKPEKKKAEKPASKKAAKKPASKAKNAPRKTAAKSGKRA